MFYVEITVLLSLEIFKLGVCLEPGPTQSPSVPTPWGWLVLPGSPLTCGFLFSFCHSVLAILAIDLFFSPFSFKEMRMCLFILLIYFKDFSY